VVAAVVGEADNLVQRMEIDIQVNPMVVPVLVPVLADHLLLTLTLLVAEVAVDITQLLVAAVMGLLLW
jgi:hypothetical protein